MATMRVARLLDRPSALLWQRLADYRGWHTWLREVGGSVMEDGVASGPASLGIVRRVGDAAHPDAREQLVGCDARAQTLRYDVLGSLPFPARNYRAEVHLVPLSDDGGTVVEWSASYDVDQADELAVSAILQGLYHSFIDALADSTCGVAAEAARA